MGQFDFKSHKQLSLGLAKKILLRIRRSQEGNKNTQRVEGHVNHKYPIPKGIG